MTFLCPRCYAALVWGWQDCGETRTCPHCSKLVTLHVDDAYDEDTHEETISADGEIADPDTVPHYGTWELYEW